MLANGACPDSREMYEHRFDAIVVESLLSVLPYVLISTTTAAGNVFSGAVTHRSLTSWAVPSLYLPHSDLNVHIQTDREHP